MKRILLPLLICSTPAWGQSISDFVIVDRVTGEPVVLDLDKNDDLAESQAVNQSVRNDRASKTLDYADNVVVHGVYDGGKRALSVPASINIISSLDLEDIALVHPSEALNSVAGVNIHRGSGQEHLTSIRSPVLTGGAGAGSFLYLEDGVPLRAAGFANVNGLFEAGTEFASKIEVFKGPGPATYGSNAVHGLISVQSKDMNEESHVTLMGNDQGLVSARISNVSDNLRTSVSIVHDSGFREDSGFDQQKFQMKYVSSVGPWSVDWLSSFNNLNQETAGFIQGDDAYKDEGVRFTNPNPEAFRDGKSYRTQARFEKDHRDNTLALTPYVRRAELRFLRHFVPGQALEKNAHSSVGLQSAYYNDDFNIGADIEFTDGSLYEFQDNPDRFSFTQGLHYDYGVKSVVGAAYAEKEFKLTPQTTLGFGVRAEYTHYNYDNNASDGQSGRFIRVADRSDSFLTVTPKFDLRYAVSEESSLYARAARGSRAPQVTDLYSVQLNQVAGEADVETLDSVEIGYKNKNRYFDLEVAGFSMWKENFFFRNANGFNVTNGKTKHLGVEATLDLRPLDWLTLTGNGTLAKHSYDFNLDEGNAANTITRGDRVDSAPDTLATVRAKLHPSELWSMGVEWRHVGKYFTNPGNTNVYEGHDIFVLRGDYHFTNTRRLFARIDNVLDTSYADRADFAFGNERFFPGRPRTVFVGLSAGF